jgi:uncharacterized membrane protein
MSTPVEWASFFMGMSAAFAFVVVFSWVMALAMLWLTERER